MAYPPSSYGERPPLQGFRRSFTAPHRQLSFHERAGLDNTDADAGILYKHPHVRIISFAPPPESVNSKSSETHTDADYPIDTVETLPWRSRKEELVTSGPLVIEKVRGSVPSIKRGPDFSQPIVRNSQCWCVDGESKFVLRKGRLQYYRFELSVVNEEEKQKVEELKSVLAKILKYERTPCPFKRAFHVELPDDAITPRRKGKWKPREGSLPPSPNTDTPPLRRSKLARSWSAQVAAPSSVGDSPSARRGSDYGFVQTPPSTSLRTSYLADRPDTPTSMTSAEGLEGRKIAEESGEEFDFQPETSEQEKRRPESPSPSPVMAEDALRPDTHTESDSNNAPEESLHVVDPSDISKDGPFSQPEAPAIEMYALETPEDDLPKGPGDLIEGVLLPEVPAEEKSLQVDDPEPSEAATEFDLLNVADIPEGTFLPSTPELHYLEEHADLLEEHGFSDEELEPLVAAAATILGISGAHEDMSQLKQAAVADNQDDNESVASTTESFHTVDSGELEREISHTSTRQDPDNVLGLRSRQHKRDISEITVTASTFSGSPRTPPLTQSSMSDESWPDPQTPSDVQQDLRRRLKSHSSLSPNASSRNVFSGGSQNQGNHLTSAILQKACNVALVKPFEMVGLLVHVLARIAGGATVSDLLSGELFKRPHRRRHSSSFPDQVTREQNDEDEDDFGVPIKGRARSHEEISKTNTRDTDADSLFDLD